MTYPVRRPSPPVTLARCPFCASDDIDIVLGHGDRYHVTCRYCRASGPHYRPKTDAVEAWNLTARRKTA